MISSFINNCSLPLPSGAAEAERQWWRGGKGLGNSGPRHRQSVRDLGDRTAHRGQVDELVVSDVTTQVNVHKVFQVFIAKQSGLKTQFMVSTAGQSWKGKHLFNVSHANNKLLGSSFILIFAPERMSEKSDDVVRGTTIETTTTSRVVVLIPHDWPAIPHLKPQILSQKYTWAECS